jgi:hypothetical protein
LLELPRDQVIAHRETPNGQTVLGGSIPIDSSKNRRVLARSNMEPATLAESRHSNYPNKNHGSLSFTINRIEDLSDETVARIWSAFLSDKTDDICKFKAPLDSFVLAKIDGNLRAFVEQKLKYPTTELIDAVALQRWPIAQEDDLATVFFERINPHLGELQIIQPKSADSFDPIANQIGVPWGPGSWNELTAEVGAHLGSALREAGLERANTEVILHIMIPPAPELPSTSNAMNWVFRDGFNGQAHQHFLADLQKSLTLKLPEMLNRNAPRSGTLSVRPHAVSRCYVNDWIPGTKEIVIAAPIKKSDSTSTR